MRALLVPRLISTDAQYDSDFISHKFIAEGVKKLEPDSFFYFWLDIRHEGKVKLPSYYGLFFEECIRSWNQQVAASVGRLVEIFNRQFGVRPVDAIFTGRAGLAPMLSVSLANLNGPPVPTVIMEGKVFALDAGPSHSQVNYTETVLRAAGYATCLCMYLSEFEKRDALNAISMFLAPAAVKFADDNGYVVELPVSSWVEHRTFAAGRKKQLLFAGRLNTNKRFKEVLEAYGKVLMTRKDVTVWVHSGTGIMKKLHPEDSRWHQASERLPIKDYKKLLADSDAGAYMSIDEGLNATVLEMVLNGISMVLSKRPWVEKLFWPMQYPFVAAESKVPQTLDWILDNLEEAYNLLTPIRAFIAEKYNQDNFERKLARVIEAIGEYTQPIPFATFRDVVMMILKKQNRSSISFSSLYASLPTSWRNKPRIANFRGTYNMYQSVRDLDDMKSAIPLITPTEADFADYERRQLLSSSQ